MFRTASLHSQGIPLACLTTREVVAAVAAAVEEISVVAVAALVEEIGVVAAGEEAETSVAAVEEETGAVVELSRWLSEADLPVDAAEVAEEPGESTCEFVLYCPHITSLLTHFPATEGRSLSPMPTSRRLKTSSSSRLVAR